MKSLLRHPLIEFVCRVALGGVFVYASIHKILHPADFAKVIYGYKILPNDLINLLAIILPYIEMLCGLCILTGVYLRGAALLSLLMLGVFMAAIAFNLIRGHEFDCGCFSVKQAGEKSNPKWLLVRDSLYFIAGWVLLKFRRNY